MKQGVELLNLLSRTLFYPLWDVRDKSIKMQHLHELERHQFDTLENIQARQWQSLKNTLDYAWKHSPYYRKQFASVGMTPADIRSPEDYLRFPITTKQDIRDNAEEFISDEYKASELITAKTGGSTGVSLRLFFDKQCEERRNAAALMSDQWSGWTLGMKKAAIWGNPPVAKTLKQKLRLALLDRCIFLDTMCLNDESMNEFVARWRTEYPQAIFGHSHSIFILAKFLHEKGITDVRPKSIVSTSMMLLQHERELIESVFQCPVTNRYGCEEVGLIACECEKHNGMHLNVEHLFVEFIREDGTPAAPGEPAKIVLTDFNNHGMPLLRYRVEDVGVPSDRKCACGRGLPLMERVEGRVADFLVAPNGSRVAGVSLVERTLTKIEGLEQMQLVQDECNVLIVNRVKAKDYTPDTDNALRQEFLTVFGPEMQVEIRDVEKIPQESSGKYRFSICRIS